MSTEIEAGIALRGDSDDTSAVLILPVDPVRATADDRPSASQDSLPALVDPAGDHQAAALRKRREDVEEKHQRIRNYLAESGQEAVLLGRSDSLAWFTSGGDLGRGLVDEIGDVLLFVNPRCRVILCDNVQSARVFEEELAGLGFQLKEWSWFQDPWQLARDLTRNKRTVCDGAPAELGLPAEREALRRLRYPLTALERQRLRELGRTLALAIEATCRNFQPGETEADVAGHLAHRLLREGVVPVDVRVAGDDRLARYRQPRFKAAEIHRHATIAAVGRRHGLCAAATRTVSFGPVDAQFAQSHALASMVDATYIFFSRPDQTIPEVFRRARRIYEKFNHPDEWVLDYQGCLLGYHPREGLLRPDSPITLAHGMPICWSPSVASARSEDTVVVDSRGYEVVTEAQRWPKLEVLVKGVSVIRPGDTRPLTHETNGHVTVLPTSPAARLQTAVDHHVPRWANRSPAIRQNTRR